MCTHETVTLLVSVNWNIKSFDYYRCCTICDHKRLIKREIKLDFWKWAERNINFIEDIEHVVFNKLK